MSDCDPNKFNATIFASQCAYILNGSDCRLESGFFNYYSWQYCAFSNRGVPSFLMICWLLVLFVVLAISADSFFAPCLVVVSKVLRMSENLAGMTLLALANGAPDVFSSFAAITSGPNPDINLALGSLLGAGILVNTIAGGIIMITSPFHVMKRPIMKDMAFYLISLLWTLLIFIRRKVELWSSLVLLLIYVVYVFVTGISRYLYTKYYKKEKIVHQAPQVIVDETTFHESFRSANSDRKFIKGDTESVGKTTYNTLQLPGGYDNQAAVFGHELSSNASSLKIADSSKRLKRLSSSSHRNTGFLVNLIIENECRHERNSNPTNNENVDIRRTQSLVVRKKSSDTNRPIFSSTIVRNYEKYKFTVDKASVIGRIEKPEVKIPTINIISVEDQGISIPTVETAAVDSIITNEEEGYYTEFPGIYWHFLLMILPFDLDNWKDQSLLEKIQAVVVSPIVFVLTLSTPVIDETAFMRGWCKLLNAWHCMASPIIFIVFIQVHMTPVGTPKFLIAYLILIIGFLLSITILVTSKAEKAPKYHWVFAFVGFLTSIAWIYEVANEIVNILTVFGVVFTIQNSLLGLTVLAFANSIGDLVSDYALAKKGYPRIGYTAVVSGPLFNLLFGLGLPLTVVTMFRVVHLILTSTTVVLISAALFMAGMNLIALPLLKFHLRPVYGIVLIVYYCVFLLLVLLFATKVINVTI